MRLILLCLLLTGCANQPPAPSYADFSAQYESMKNPNPERVIFDFEPACNDEGMCYVEEKRLQAAADIITNLNTAYQKSVEAGNLRIDSISHCEYAGAQKDLAIGYLEQRSTKQDITSQIKQFITMAGCGALLWAK